MRIEREKVNSYVETLRCECGGEMQFAKPPIFWPPDFPHKCTECGAEEVAENIYPRTVTEPKSTKKGLSPDE